jgi:hypothetical protein
MEAEKAKAGLDLLRQPFSANHISKLPKPTKAQTDAVKADFKTGMRCQLCGSWHHKDVVHLDYVGHAALTDRLLDADPEWSWEPMATADGLPAFDRSGGLWIKLTVCGVTRLGYGHAAAKPNQDPGAREKEVIGDALRNAAMRFGAALDLWHKGDLHGDAGSDNDGGGGDTACADSEQPSEPRTTDQRLPQSRREHPAAPSKSDAREVYARLSNANRALASEADFDKFWNQANVKAAFESLPADWRQKMVDERNDKAAELQERAAIRGDDPFVPIDEISAENK